MIPVSRRLFLLAPGVSLAVALLPGLTRADTDPRAVAAYQAGQWAVAAERAQAAGDADGLAFAARARLAAIMLEGARRAPAASVRAARDLAERAVRLTPAHVEGRLQLATAIGMQARQASPASAMAQGLPQRAHSLLVDVIRTQPGAAWAHGLLGGWNLEGLRIGGPAARALLGANEEAGRAAFQRAMALDPAEPSFPFYCAVALFTLAPERTAREAAALARTAAAAQGQGAFQTAIRARAARLSDSLAAGDTGATRTLALSWL